MNKEKASEAKAFGLLSAVFLGIGSMVGAGIFIVIGEAGVIAGNLVTVSFLIGGIIALLCGYSLSKLAIRYPSRGGMIEYLVQGYGEGFFSGSLGVLFYFAQLVALSAVAKSFGTYAATYMSGGVTPLYANLFAVAIVIIFVAAALLTPPDILTQLLMAAPLIILYGISILIVRAVNPAPKEEDDESEEEA